MKLFKIKTWINAFLLVGIIFVAVRVFIPGYPTIDKRYSLNKVQNFIKDIIKEEARNISFQNIDTSTHGGASVKYIRAIENFMHGLEKCAENKECIIEEYNDFMRDNVSDILRKKTKAYYMIRKFGVAGEQFNKSLGFMF
jgi:xanthosine utilization system XapX-like protein